MIKDYLRPNGLDLVYFKFIQQIVFVLISDLITVPQFIFLAYSKTFILIVIALKVF